jgi:hypothetical protein
VVIVGTVQKSDAQGYLDGCKKQEILLEAKRVCRMSVGDARPHPTPSTSKCS